MQLSKTYVAVEVMPHPNLPRERKRELRELLKAHGLTGRKRFQETEDGWKQARAYSDKQRVAAEAAGLPMDEIWFYCDKSFSMREHLIDNNDDFDHVDFFKQLEGDSFDNVQVKTGTTAQKFDCPECLGTGRYQGARVHQEKSHCFACRGLGYFKTDPRKLKQARVARAKAKNDAFIAFHETNADVIREIGNAADWSDFARSRSNVIAERKVWSDRQLASARSMAAKLVAKREAKAAERKAATVAVDLSRIEQLFEAAGASGYKRPTYRAEGLVISKAAAHGRNPGALYVKDAESDAYLGKVMGGTYQPVRGGETAKDALLTIAADPLAAAIRYGQRTGTCSCCGRTLTKHASIDAGIGPICAEKWGL